MPKSEYQKEGRPWFAKFSDGSAKLITSKINPRGTALSYLKKEQEKGHMIGVTLVSVDPVSRAALNKPTPPKKHVDDVIKNTQPLSLYQPPQAEEEIKEEEEKEEETTDIEADAVLLEMINDGMHRVDHLAQAYIKLYDLSTENNEFYDNLFLLAFVRRLSRINSGIVENLEEIEKNLSE